MAIMRPGRGFGVVLHAERRIIAVPDAFDRLVVQAAMSHFQMAGQRSFVDGKAVVLRSDLNRPRVESLHRLDGQTSS